MANVHPGNHHHHALIGGGGGGVGGGGGGGDGLPPGPTHPLAALFYAALVGGPVAVHAPAKSSLLEWLSSLPHLTTIDIQRTNVEVHELECLSAITGLGHLGVGDLTLESPLRMEPLCSVTKLVTHNCDGARLLPQVFPQLRGLSCDACDETLADLAPLTGLHHLLLWQQPSPLTPLTDAGLCSLAGMAGLQELRLEGATGLSDAGWSSFASSHAHLTRLHLTGVAGVSSAAIGVAAASTPALQAVLLSSMPVDAAGLASLLALCPSLSSIELEDCDHLSQADVRTAMAEMPRALGVGVGVGGDLTVVCRKGGAFKKLHWPPVAT
ncbi:hypothetical protein FOA52_001434 [Chlamydomonas sp. UWO 241]|nr:hypothetical protein FOA52_001434 [Chlamydomonas sp. UWO 241]